MTGVLPRLHPVDFGEPELTYGDEFITMGKARALLHVPGGKLQHFQGPGEYHFLFLTSRPCYWLVKGYFGWQSLDDVQWWRVHRYWRSLNVLLGGLTIILRGIIGVRAAGRVHDSAVSSVPDKHPGRRLVISSYSIADTAERPVFLLGPLLGRSCGR